MKIACHRGMLHLSGLNAMRKRHAPSFCSCSRGLIFGSSHVVSFRPFCAPCGTSIRCEAIASVYGNLVGPSQEILLYSRKIPTVHKNPIVSRKVIRSLETEINPYKTWNEGANGNRLPYRYMFDLTTLNLTRRG